MTTYSQVGSTAVNDGASVLTVGISPANIGDLIVLCFDARGFSGAQASSGVSGGNVATWNQATGYLDTGTNVVQEIWWGVTTGTGSSTITVTNPDGGAANSFNALRAAEYSASPSGTWALVAANPATPGSGANTQSGTTCTYPMLTGNGIYIGTAIAVFNGFSSGGGSTPGFTYEEYSSNHIQVVSDLSASNAGPTSPLPSNDSFSPVGALFGVSGGGGGGESGPFNPTLPGPSLSLAGTVGHLGALNLVLPPPVLSLAGHTQLTESGPFNITLPGPRLSLAGTVPPPPAVASRAQLAGGDRGGWKKLWLMGW